ncbi:helix-turn-helix transcriptional regulator [Croceibacterium sp. TMG7-5b_MA50]|uniref:helix-turn-helix domain-containing protein n=1 Tax=Croceibacterium sp. TMG7-5b_MA50 TaxID=3121290 RepID=UPI003221594D
MSDFDQATGGTHGIGAELRAAREARGLSLEQVAADTRIPQRHLVTLESGAFHTLPGRTYATGFARSYAKVLGLDPDVTADRVRAEMTDAREQDGSASFEPGDPARVPSRGLVWLALAAVVLLLLAGFFIMRPLFAPAAELPSLVEQQQQEQAARQAALARQQAGRAPGQPAGAPAGPVVFTATVDGVWVKFYDSTGRQLMQKQMAMNEQYQVPADAQGPLLWTGRPDALRITIGGREVPRLADDDMIMKDVPVTAEALLARNQPTPTPAATPPASPAPGFVPSAVPPRPAQPVQ